MPDRATTCWQLQNPAGMTGHRVAIYYAWSRPGERSAPLTVIEDRFPTLFESRRMLYPRLAELSDPIRFDQTVTGFLDHIHGVRRPAAWTACAGFGPTSSSGPPQDDRTLVDATM